MFLTIYKVRKSSVCDLIRTPRVCRYHKEPLGVKGRYGAHTGDANRGGRLGPRSNNEE